MKLSTLNPIFREALATHEAMRKLGFLPENIFASIGSGSLFVEVETLGKRFSIRIGQMPLSFEKFSAVWTEATHAYNSGSDDELYEIWDHSLIRRELPKIMAKMKEKGIVIPALVS